MSMDIYRKRYPTEIVLDGSDVAQQDTFGEIVDLLVIQSDVAIWIDETDVATAGDGATEGRRLRVSADTIRHIPWHSGTVTAVNISSGATGTVFAEGWVL